MPRLRTPNQSKPLQAVLWLIDALASLQLAVVLIGIFIVVMAYATLIDEWYGPEPAQFGIYGSWWFMTLGVLLGLNVLLSMLVRYPWQRRQTGFVVTHLGILVLLGGSLASYHGGMISSLAVYEGKENHIAVCSTRHLEIRSVAADASDDALLQAEPAVAALATGPFSWRDYAERSWFPWALVAPRPGVVYQKGGLKVELLDFLADSRRTAIPRIKLAVAPAAAKFAGHGQDSGVETLELCVSAGAHGMRSMRPGGMGERRETPLGQYVTFSMARSDAETAAFLACRSEGQLEPLGQVVFYVGGKVYRFSVAEFQKKSRLPLGETGLEVELVQFEPSMLGVQLRVISAQEGARPMTLFASLPHFNRQDDLDGVYGEYFVDAKAAQAGDLEPSLRPQGKALMDAARPRIDILQSHDKKLYYRTVRDGKVLEAKPWPTGREEDRPLIAFAGESDAIRLQLDEFTPSAEPDWVVEPVKFDRKSERTFQPRARLRVSLGQEAKEFWLAAPAAEMQADQEQIFTLGGRKLLVVMPQDQIELGFAVKLDSFQRKLDPGAMRAAHYGSKVDLLEEGTQRAIARAVEIKVNGPIDVADPRSGKTWRLFQASFEGPFKPGSEVFEQVAGPQSPRKQIYRSVFSANYDPGRGLKYAGSLLIVAGIAIIYYMRAYFFAKHKRPGEASAA